MPITGRKPWDCYEHFRAHVAELISDTLTQRFPLHVTESIDSYTLSFRDHTGPITVPLDTTFGRLYFYFAHALRAPREGTKFVLHTHGYWYRLHARPGPNEKALIRWEYVADENPFTNRPARHHVQIASGVSFQNGRIDLNKVHVPTGRVPFEEVLRFLFTDLGVPPRRRDWATLLAISEEKFHLEFRSKDYYPPR